MGKITQFSIEAAVTLAPLEFVPALVHLKRPFEGAIDQNEA